ncbi:MAG: helix-turn-helix transcriptional regulator [Gemmatimonadetes bacterium]|nr:helix-turn-helix transcriptional regulator [Gemmatimonadota bacterium]MDA1103178.1 helix-turn-helix transcriptional regulator [Gemmatimonadota bacterium]
MVERAYLGELEQAVLWAVLRLDGAGYGASVLKELNARVDRRVSPGALYATVDRLEEKAMLESRLADADAGRGGRRKRYLTVTAAGREALQSTRQEWQRLWGGLEEAMGTHEP